MTVFDGVNTDVRGEIRGFLTDNFLYMRPELELQDNDDLLELAVLDSLGFVELVEEVQARYAIEVRDLEITEANFGSIDAIVRFVQEKRRAVLR